MTATSTILILDRDADDYARQVHERLSDASLRAEVDLRNEADNAWIYAPLVTLTGDVVTVSAAYVRMIASSAALVDA